MEPKIEIKKEHGGNWCVFEDVAGGKAGIGQTLELAIAEYAKAVRREAESRASFLKRQVPLYPARLKPGQLPRVGDLIG